MKDKLQPEDSYIPQPVTKEDTPVNSDNGQSSVMTIAKRFFNWLKGDNASVQNPDPQYHQLLETISNKLELYQIEYNTMAQQIGHQHDIVNKIIVNQMPTIKTYQECCWHIKKVKAAITDVEHIYGALDNYSNAIKAYNQQFEDNTVLVKVRDEGLENKFYDLKATLEKSTVLLNELISEFQRVTQKSQKILQDKKNLYLKDLLILPDTETIASLELKRNELLAVQFFQTELGPAIIEQSDYEQVNAALLTITQRIFSRAQQYYLLANNDFQAIREQLDAIKVTLAEQDIDTLKSFIQQLNVLKGQLPIVDAHLVNSQQILAVILNERMSYRLIADTQRLTLGIAQLKADLNELALLLPQQIERIQFQAMLQQDEKRGKDLLNGYAMVAQEVNGLIKEESSAIKPDLLHRHFPLHKTVKEQERAVDEFRQDINQRYTVEQAKPLLAQIESLQKELSTLSHRLESHHEKMVEALKHDADMRRLGNNALSEMKVYYEQLKAAIDNANNVKEQNLDNLSKAGLIDYKKTVQSELKILQGLDFDSLKDNIDDFNKWLDTNSFNKSELRKEFANIKIDELLEQHQNIIHGLHAKDDEADTRLEKININEAHENALNEALNKLTHTCISLSKEAEGLSAVEKAKSYTELVDANNAVLENISLLRKQLYKAGIELTDVSHSLDEVADTLLTNRFNQLVLEFADLQDTLDKKDREVNEALTNAYPDEDVEWIFNSDETKKPQAETKNKSNNNASKANEDVEDKKIITAEPMFDDLKKAEVHSVNNLDEEIIARRVIIPPESTELLQKPASTSATFFSPPTGANGLADAKTKSISAEVTLNSKNVDFDLRPIVKEYVDKRKDHDNLRYIKQKGQYDVVEIGPKNKLDASLEVYKNSITARGEAAYQHLLAIAINHPDIAYHYNGTEDKLKAMLAVFKKQIAAEKDVDKKQQMHIALSKMTFLPEGLDKKMTVAAFEKTYITPSANHLRRR